VGYLKAILLWLSLSGAAFSQNKDSLACVRFLQRETARLCRFEGRGFAGKGYQKAARYLYQRFHRMGYAVEVDTFRHTVRYVERAFLRPVGGRPWKVGIDFWPHPSSPPIEGTYEVTLIPQRRKLWLLPDTLSLASAFPQALSHQIAGILRPLKKVTATYAENPLPFALIEIAQPCTAGENLKISIQVRHAEVENYNILARRPGMQDSLWIVGAHYDHLGRVGQTVFWGANDNASGVAFMLLLAKRLREERLPYGVLFVAFGGEEAGLLGSYYFVGRHGAELTRLRGMLNFDLLGFGERGVAVVGAADQEGFWGMVVRHRPPELADIPHLLRPNAPNSDHYPFREKGYPALFFYLQGGPGYYHDPLDRPETLSWHGAYSLLRWMEALLKAE